MTSAHAQIPRSDPETVAAGAENLTKVYGAGDTAVHALRGVTIEFATGEFTAIMGPSGSGKSTLMHCLAGLDDASGGRAYIGDDNLTGLSDKEMTRLRRDRIGFVFQSFNLVPTLTAAENITLPLDIAGRDVDQQWFDAVVNRLGIATGSGICPPNCRGASSSAWRAPVRWSAGPPSSSATSPPATWTPARPVRCSRSCVRPPTSSARPS